MKTTVSDILRGIRFAFFPRRCPFCGRVIAPDESVCGKCGDDVQRVTLPICYACGRSRLHCVCRHAHNRFISAFASPLYYTGYTKQAIRRMKFGREPEITQALSAEMAAFARDVYYGVSFDVVTFVPMTRAEHQERGYNQSAMLAEQTAQALSLPCAQLLCKLYETARQRTLRRRLRSGNVMGVFDVTNADAVRGKRILLCDDLMTTGATLNECAKMLCIAGAREVFCLTAAIALPYWEGENQP